MNIMPRPTEADLEMICTISDSLNQQIANLYLQHMIDDGELLELMRRERP